MLRLLNACNCMVMSEECEEICEEMSKSRPRWHDYIFRGCCLYLPFVLHKVYREMYDTDYIEYKDADLVLTLRYSAYFAQSSPSVILL